MFVDDTLTNGAVEERVLFGVKPDEIVGTVVELVAVKMMADLSGFGQAPEGGTNEFVDKKVFFGNKHLRINTTFFVMSRKGTKSWRQFVSFGVENVAVGVGVIRFSEDELRRNEFDNRNSNHNTSHSVFTSPRQCGFGGNAMQR